MTALRLTPGLLIGGRRSLLTHAVAEPAGWVHQVAAYLALLAPFGVEAAPTPPTLAIDPARRVEARRLLQQVDAVSGAPRVGLQLGAALGPAKLWPSARIAELAMRLEARGIHPVLLGSPAARGLADAVQAASSRFGRLFPGSGWESSGVCAGGLPLPTLP